MATQPRVSAGGIIEECARLGFALAGVCEAAASARAEFFRGWLAAGMHGEMEWLARNADVRLDPRALLPGARSIIVVADRYAPRAMTPQADEAGTAARADASAPPLGRVARYAQGADYHDAMKRRLHALCDLLRAAHAGHDFRACVDTAPLMEREHAARAGLGWIGKHTLLIHPRLGSWLFLGAVVATLDIEPTCDEGPPPEPDHCGTCTRCIDACPTGALTPYAIDARKCVSYLTIEHRSAIEDSTLREGMGDWLFGCDVCQEVCPHNSPRSRDDGAAPNPAYAPRFESLDAQAVARWDEEDRRRTLSGSAMKRANLEMLRRNAAIVLENSAATRPARG